MGTGIKKGGTRPRVQEEVEKTRRKKLEENTTEARTVRSHFLKSMQRTACRIAERKGCARVGKKG